MKNPNRKSTVLHVFLSDYKYDIEHFPGKGNELIDAPFRHPDSKEASSGQPDLDRMVPPKVSNSHVTDTPVPPTLKVVSAPTLVDEITEA